MTRALVALILAATSARADSLGAERYRLANGLEVILAPDASQGAVVVHVRYRAGTADDPPDKEGLARVVAHFAAVRYVRSPDSQSTPIEEVGGWDTSSLGADHVSFTTDVPANALALALYAQADRMAGFRDRVVGAFVDGFVKHVRLDDMRTWRPGFERALWSADHRDVDVRDGIGKVTADDLKDWWRRFGAPGNATLVIAGAFDPAEAKRLVERYFAWIPGRPSAPPPRVEVTPLGRLVDTSFPGSSAATALAIGFRAPPPAASATADLDVAARILAGGKASWLYRRLVIADRVATEVSASVIIGSRSQLVFEIAVRDRDALAPARAAMFDELGKLRATVTADEIARAKAGLLHDKLLALEGLAFRAEHLAAWAAYGDDFAAWRARLDGVTVSSLQGTARRWLAEDAAVVMAVFPVKP